MKNIYVIVSPSKIVIDTNIQKILKKNQKIEPTYYDLEEVNIEQIIKDLDTYNFLTEKKIIVGKNACFLSPDKKEIEHNLSKLEKYLENPNPENVLILTVSSLDRRKKITAKVIESCEVIEEKEENLEEFIKKNLEDYKMSSESIKLLIEYCRQNTERAILELEKLKMLKLDEKEILSKDIQQTVLKDIDDNIFSLVDFIMKKNKKEAFEIYKDLLLQGEQISSIISKLANKIRLIYQVKTLTKNGKSELEISKLLKMHPYPIKLAHESSYHYSDQILLEYLEKLAKIDYDLKSGKGNPNIVLETFIAEI